MQGGALAFMYEAPPGLASSTEKPSEDFDEPAGVGKNDKRPSEMTVRFLTLFAPSCVAIDEGFVDYVSKSSAYTPKSNTRVSDTSSTCLRTTGS